MKKSMIFFDSLCSLIRAVSTLMKYYVQLRWRERERVRERENGNENENERKRICRSTKLNDICFFLLLGGQNQLDGPEKLSRFFKLTKYSQEMSMRTGCACI
jgi:hypothetical protein